MKSRSVVYLILLFGSVYGWSQGTAANKEKIQDAASKGFRLTSGTAVPASIRVEPVLLPAKICRHLFGKEIAENYAAVALIVSNKNQDAAFIVHSIYLDYTDWLLGKNPQNSKTVEYQASTLDNQVASVEYRIARGEAQDAQLWSGRNWTMRSLMLLGVIATGSEFAFKEQGITKAIGAFTGQVVPAAGAFWPDGAQAQMDRISDFGYRANKVVAKASSEIIVAFFPIDRFITPGLKKVYLKSPALFFLPTLGALDTKLPAEAKELLNKLNGGKALSLEDLEKDGKPTSTFAMLEKISMNRIRITVGGVMALDVDKIPARVDSVTFDDKSDWTKAGSLTGVIGGALLSNGQPAIDAAADDKTKYTISLISDGSSDTELHFKLDIPAAVPACTSLTFHVTKTSDSKSSDGKTVDSNKFTYKIPGTCPAAK